MNGDGVATWQEFGNQNRSPAPLPPPVAPEPTPVTNEQVIGGLDNVMQALQAFRELLNRRLTGSDNGGGAQPAPTPSATPVTNPTPVTSPTPVTRADACVETLTLSDTIYPTWSDDCATDRVPTSAAGVQGPTSGPRYARFYTFTLSQASTATITLTSEAVPDTYLYLLEGAGRDGAVLYENDDIDTAGGNSGSRISESLPAGSYTIVATTFNTGQTGDFRLEALVSVAGATQ